MSSDNAKPVRNLAAVDDDTLANCLKLLDDAHAARRHSYSPYSGIQVGAALLSRDGEVFTGVNVENGSYGLTICAERAALFSAVAKGVHPGGVSIVAIAATVENFSPCGACREVLAEFSREIIIVFEFGSVIMVVKLADLLPFNFIFPDVRTGFSLPASPGFFTNGG